MQRHLARLGLISVRQPASRRVDRAFRRFAQGLIAVVVAWFGQTALAIAADPPPDKPPVAETSASNAIDLSAFDATSKLATLDIDAIGDAKKDTNFSGVAFNPVTKTLMIVDNQPNAGSTKDKPDEGDLYEFDLNAKLLRHIDLAGFSDPEGIACMGVDPKNAEHDLYVIAEERICTLTVVSIPRGKESVKLTRGECGPIITPKPNPIDDGNDQPNDGLEGVAYDANADVFYMVKEGGSTRGVYRVARDGTCAGVKIAGLTDGVKGKSDPLADLADIQFHNGQLLVLSEISNVVVAIRVKDLEGEIVGQFPGVGELLPHKQPEGIAASDDGQSLWIIGEPREFARYGHKKAMPPAK